jgi:type III secretory pathway lipoprotein EscJ
LRSICRVNFVLVFILILFGCSTQIYNEDISYTTK